MGITVIVRGADSIALRFANSQARREMIRVALDAHLGLLHGAVVPLTPVGVTAVLRNAWATESHVSGGPYNEAGSFQGILGNPTSYADVIERGRHPGATPPPPTALAAWYAVKLGGDPWGGQGQVEGSGIWFTPVGMLALSISRKGIKGRRMLLKAIEATHEAAAELWGVTAARLVEGSG